MAELLHPDEKRWFYRTHRVPKRGVYDEDGKQVAYLWTGGRQEDRKRGILMANCREMHALLERVVEAGEIMEDLGMDSPSYREAKALLAEINNAIEGKT